MRNLAIIPARGGSKRIPHKNIKPFLGKPIIAYSIEAALKSGLFDEVMVSTDDCEIAKIAISYGAKVPFMRSAANSSDLVFPKEVYKEVLQCYADKGLTFDNMCCIFPTAPLIQSDWIINGYNKLISSHFSLVYPVTPFSYPIWRCLDLAEDGTLNRHWPEFSNCRSQDLPVVYHDSGTYYWYKIPNFLNEDVIIGGIVVDELYVQDIDNYSDWEMAELKYKFLHNN